MRCPDVGSLLCAKMSGDDDDERDGQQTTAPPTPYTSNRVMSQHSGHGKVYSDALNDSSNNNSNSNNNNNTRALPRRTSVRSSATSTRSRGNGGSGGGMESHTQSSMQAQVMRLSRTLDVEFLEKMVPSRGPKDASDKESELIGRLLRHMDESTEGGTGGEAFSRAGGGVRTSTASHPMDWSSGGDLNPEAAAHALSMHTSSTSSSSDGSSVAGADVSGEKTAAIQDSLNAILRELRRCETAKSTSPSLRQKLMMRKSNLHHESKEFVKCVKRNIKMVEGMLPEASELGHNDLAQWMSQSSEALAREISAVLLSGSKASAVPWDMLHLQTSSIMADVRNKWDLAAEARKTFQSFAQVCVAKYMQQQRKAHSQRDRDSFSESKRDTDSMSQQGVFRKFQEAQRAASTSGRYATEGSSGSVRSFYRDSRSEPVSSDYQIPRSPASTGRLTFNRSSSRGNSMRSHDEQMAINIARWGGDRDATTDLISRIRALSPQALGHIHEE